ncbi:hypothetical protein ACQEVF_59615 [Nonomuraea polychroma]|uniref:hypothetical protein n=1 Tax=Nonomuraea polychroma TaxID=46176 RepID=UPI003D8B9AC6
MASKTAQLNTARVVTEGGVVTENMVRYMAGKALATVAPHTAPWLFGAGMLPVSMATHAWWGTAAALPWASAGLALSGAGLTAVTWAVSRYRHALGRLQSTGTAAVASGWLLAATITGPTSRPTLDLGIWAGATLATAWNIRSIIRPKIDPEGAMLAPGGPGSLFKALFTQGQDKVEVEGVRNVKVGANAIAGTVQLGGGDTAEDLQRALPGIEAQHGLPGGSLMVTPNRANAGEPTATMTNPLLLDNPIPHPGPSAPGASVAKPLMVSTFQDGTQLGLGIVGQHLQIMGMTGAAKTTAIAWGIWGEFVTRADGALVVVDITKRDQTVAPARPALHGAVTEVNKARAFFKEWLPAWAEERLAEMGKRELIAWEEGCGLTYLLVSLEEAADVFEHIDMAEFVNLARMLRSAGGGFIWSLQRADSSQMPTIVKGQGGGKICAGVESAHDAGWGLTEEQEKAGAKPQQWRANHPGMAYADAQGVTRERIAMPSRFYDWGPTNAARVANFAAHCAQYPAEARPVDPITAKLLAKLGGQPTTPGGQPAGETKEASVAGEYLKPDPEMDAQDSARPVNPDADLPDAPDVPLGGAQAQKMPPEEARVALDRALQAFADGQPFAPRDLGGVLGETGLGRAWLQKQLKAKVSEGVLEHDPDADKPYRVRVLAGV